MMMRKLLKNSDGKLLKNLHSSCGKNLMAFETLQKRFDHTLYISSSKLFEKGLSRQDNIAIITNQHHTEKHHHQQDQHEEFVTTKHSYSDLIRDSSNFANKLVDQYCSESALFDRNQKVKLLTNEKICFLFDPGYDYTVTLWSIWRANGTAVPLCNTHPTKELKYYIVDSQCKVVIYQKEKKSSLEPLFEEMKHIKFVEYENSLTKPIDNSKLQVVDLNQNDKENGSLIVYTSGTTGNPKAVVLTFSNILTQANILCSEWEWSEKDQILHLLPLHHVHGLINALTCPLYCAATIEFLKFNPEQVWKKLTNSDKKQEEKKINVFMAVPTIYVKLIHYYDELSHKTQQHYTEQIEKLRLMVSGSSALPTSVYSKWKKISHHNLLERFGMSEIQMAISNPMNKEKRKMGCVGFPLPTVEVKIVDFETREEITKPNEPGELLVKGPSVFKEYLGRPDATKKAFTQDGYFITGDSVLIDEEGYYKICGRLSSDIIKSGGYKISALDIERVILDMSKIKECAVLGVQDEEYGERVGALISLHKGQTLTLKELQDFCSQELAKYKLPTRLVVLPEGEEIPKNAMGKVAKKSLVKLFSSH